MQKDSMKQKREDWIDYLDYYSNEINIASFVFQTKQHKDITGIAKR